VVYTQGRLISNPIFSIFNNNKDNQRLTNAYMTDHDDIDVEWETY